MSNPKDDALANVIIVLGFSAIAGTFGYLTTTSFQQSKLIQNYQERLENPVPETVIINNYECKAIVCNQNQD